MRCSAADSWSGIRGGVSFLSSVVTPASLDTRFNLGSIFSRIKDFILFSNSYGSSSGKPLYPQLKCVYSGIILFAVPPSITPRSKVVYGGSNKLFLSDALISSSCKLSIKLIIRAAAIIEFAPLCGSLE